MAAPDHDVTIRLPTESLDQYPTLALFQFLESDAKYTLHCTISNRFSRADTSGASAKEIHLYIDRIFALIFEFASDANIETRNEHMGRKGMLARDDDLLDPFPFNQTILYYIGIVCSLWSRSQPKTLGEMGRIAEGALEHSDLLPKGSRFRQRPMHTILNDVTALNSDLLSHRRRMIFDSGFAIDNLDTDTRVAYLCDFAWAVKQLVLSSLFTDEGYEFQGSRSTVYWACSPDGLGKGEF